MCAFIFEKRQIRTHVYVCIPGSRRARLAVAPVGSTVLNPDGDDDDDEVVTVRKTSVGGVLSEGIFLDSVMLGWTGGAAGVAAQMPNSIPRGTAPPSRKPRPDDDGKAATESANAAADGGGGTDVGEGLFEKKLSKEEKKKLAEERRQARKAAKEAKNKES